MFKALDQARFSRQDVMSIKGRLKHADKLAEIARAYKAVSVKERLLLFVYLAVTRCLPARLIIWVVKRGAHKGGEETAERAGERAALNMRQRPSGKVFWLNSIGPGDSTANQGLVAELLLQDPRALVLITTRTVSAQGIFSRWKDEPRVIIQLAPHDSLYASRRFLSHWQPSAAIFCERDLWPNMLRELTARRIPIAIVNGQLDGRLLKDLRKVQSLGRWMLSHVDYIHIFSETCAELAQEWMRPGAVVFQGRNLKLDCPPLESKPALEADLAKIWRGKHIFTAASVATREVRDVIEAFRLANIANPDLRLILVPRWKYQSDDFYTAVKVAGFAAPRRSIEGLPQTTDPILIADTYGELGTWYGLSFAAFIGDTFHNGSGHNPYEAILRGIPVLAGGIGRLFRADFEALVDAEVCRLVETPEEMAQAITEFAGGITPASVVRFLDNRGSAARVARDLIHLSHTDAR